MELDSLDRKTRKLMTIHYALRPRSDVDRLYLPRKLDGRGLLQVKQTVEEEKHALADYVKNSTETSLLEVKNREVFKVKQTKGQYRKTTMQIRADSWHNKALHGQFLEKIKGKVDEEKTWLWLTKGTLKKETEALIFAVQEQAIRKNAVKARIEKSAESPTCDSRVTEKQLENITRYQDLKIELQRLWHKLVQVVPVIIGTLGAVLKELSKYLEEIGVDKVTISQLQKAALLGSAHIIY
ncbi:hypothetical protein JRQ81_001352 [Phrynocephalus forsythii]|uniref:Uncharacterized protein n=1 Tax=Phrynocephalus forsythii TaxID=171643 RepID=A0A9Q0Y852_9SAUR|nr:hypothetical protein JRQ81_001352 [Phrynocephalus forsythii]